MGQALPRCQVCRGLSSSLEGAEPSGQALCSDQDESKAGPSQNKHPAPSVPGQFTRPASSHTAPCCQLRKGWPWAGRLPTHPSPPLTWSESRGSQKTVKYFPQGSPILMQEVTDPKGFLPYLACLGAWNFTVKSLFLPISDSLGTKFS